MNLAQARQQWPHLNDYTDQELLEIAAQQNGVGQDDPRFNQLEKEFLGYDRSAGEIAKDTTVGLGQGLLNLGQLGGNAIGAVVPGMRAFDNPIANTFGGWSEGLNQFKSQGLRNQEAGAQLSVDIAERDAAARGAGTAGRIGAGAMAQVGNYWDNPSLAFQDLVTNAPQLLAGGFAGRGAQLLAGAAGAGARTAARTGLASGIGTSASMQGADVGQDVYDRAIAAGAPPELATQLATEATAKAAGASVGLSLLPGGSAIERSLVRGMGPGRLGLGMAGRGVGEGLSEAGEEGYGQFAGNQAVQTVDPSVDLASGVGSAAVQGAAVGGPLGAILRPSAPAPKPRTDTGEIDLTAGAPGVNESESPGMSIRWRDDPDTPTFMRQGLDPLNERPVGPPRPPSDPTMVDIAGPIYEPTPASFVDLADPPPGLPPDPFAGQTPARPPALTAAPIPAPVEAPAAAPAPQQPAPLMVDSSGVVMPFQTPEQLAAIDAARAAQATQAGPVTERTPTRGDILAAITELKRTYVRKDGDLANNAGGIAMRPILEAKDPVAAIREQHKDGSGNRDEFLDELHKKLTGRTVFEWREAQQPADTNSAGFVPETQENIFAQIEALKQGRKKALVLGEEEAKTIGKPKGLSRAVAKDPNTGETAVVLSPDRAVVQRAVARTQEVGLKQAMGETLEVANPTLTSQPPGAPVAAVQQVDNQSGAILSEEIVTPADLPNVKPIPGTTQQVVPANQPVEQRRAAAKQLVNAVNSMPPAAQTAVDAGKKSKKAKVPKFGNSPTEKVIEAAETTKEQDALDAAEYELYKRWVNNADEAAENYFLADVKAQRKHGDSKALTFNSTPRAKALQARLDAELEEKGVEAGQKLGKKFGSVKLRQADEQDKPAMTLEQATGALDTIRASVPAAADIGVVQSLAAVGLEGEFPAGTKVAGVTFPDGRIVLVADGLTSAADVTRTVFHELFHRGVAHTPDYVKVLQGIAARDPWVRAEANKWKLTPDGKRTAQTRSGPALDAIAIEEALARMSERVQGGAGTGSQSRSAMVRTLSNWLASVADILGMKDLARWVRRQSYTEAEKFVMDMVRNAANPTDGGPTGGQTEVRARVADAAAAPEPATLKPFSGAAKAVAAVQAQAAGREISPLLLKGLTLRQIEEQFGKKLPALREWIGAIFERSSHASRLAAKADRVALKWEKSVKNKAERQALADVLLRASVAEVSLDNTSAEYLASLDADQRSEHATLRQKLAALPKEAQDARKEALAVLRDQWKYTHDSLVSFINHTIADPGLRTERIKQLEEEMGRNRGDYFPLSRFGERVVIGRGAAKDGRDVISFHESAGSADAEVQRLKQAGVKHIVSTLQTARDPRQRASTGFMADLHGEIDKAEMDPSVKDSMHEALQQLYLKSLPEMSGAKHMIRREGLEGFSQDALRVFADAVTRGARYASHLDYGPRIQAAMEAAEAQARSSDKRSASVVIGTKDGQAPVVQVVPMGTDRYNTVNQMMDDGYTVDYFDTVPETVRERLAARLEGATPEQVDGYVQQAEAVVGRSSEGVEDLRAAKQLYNHMVNLQKTEGLEDPNKLTEVLGQAGYAWFLGFTPAFWLMNMMQNPMIGIPHLGAKYGVGKASVEWGAAMRWFGGVRMGKLLADGKTPFSVEWLKSQKLPGITKQELDMLQRLEDRQVLDFTQAMDLSRIGQASDGMWNKGMRLAAAGAHHTEVFNRVTFALAAYRLALKSNGNITHDEAVRRAEDDVAAVHFDYSFANKPQLMKGQVARLIFMFQQYRQHMLYWWANTVKEAVKGETREDKARAYKAAFLMGATNALFAGALGMPFVGSVAFLLNMFGPDDEDGVPFDFERWVTEAAKEATGSDKAAQVMSKGIFTALGMNIGQRIGQGDLMPFLNEGSGRFERNADDKMRAFITDLLGPLGSIAVGAARSTEAFARGDTVGGLAQSTPKAVADILKSYQLGTEGIKNGRGQILASQEAFDGADVFLQAAGVMPSSAANIKADRGRVIEIDNAFKDKTRRLTGNFTEAWARQDREGVAQAMAEIQAYNQKVASGKLRDPSLLIDKRKLESAIRDRQQRALILALTGGTADSKRQMLIALRMSGLINAVTPESMQQNAFDLPGLPGLN